MYLLGQYFQSQLSEQTVPWNNLSKKGFAVEEIWEMTNTLASSGRHTSHISMLIVLRSPNAEPVKYTILPTFIHRIFSLSLSLYPTYVNDHSF